MRHRRRCFLTLVFLFLLTSITHAQQTWPHTLLWRISGNGLSKASYLYGTMHLQDKRLFNFGDSLYRALETTEGLALELDVNEMIDSVFSRQLKDAENRALENEKLKIDRKKLGRTADSLLNKFGIRENHITKKDLKRIREYRINKITSQGEMPTFMDAYLYGLALRQNKWTGGIEDVTDQIDLKDELGADLSPENVFQPEQNLRSSLEKMINIYLEQDLQKLNAYMGNSYSPEEIDRMLIHRNVKMARRMDSLTAIRTMFFAVGAAHLPGDSGVISLLRSRGFRVEPVFSTRKVPVEQYATTVKTVPWNRVEDNEKIYGIEMPGKPKDYNIFGEAFKMKFFFDLTTMTFYMSGYTVGRLDDSVAVNKVFRNMAERMGVNSSEVKKKDVSRNDLKAVEGSFENMDGSYRVQLLQKNKLSFLLLAGSTKKATMASQDINRFFASFEAHDISTNEKWTGFRLPEKAFSVMLPGQPKPNKTIDSKAEGSIWTFTTYDYLDNVKGIYYLVQVRDLNGGYYMNGDSVYFSVYKDDFAKKVDTISRYETATYAGFPALYLEASSDQQNLLFKSQHVIRGGRIYTLLAIGNKATDFSGLGTFFNSLRLEDYLPSDWKAREGDGFRTTGPAPVKKLESSGKDSTNAGGEQKYVLYDANESLSYHVIREPYSSYYWAKNDSALFNQYINMFRNKADTILKTEFKANGGHRSLDLELGYTGNHNREKVRLLVNGDTLYTLMAYIPAQYIDREVYQRFFNDFRVSKEIPAAIYTKKEEKLQNALLSADSIQFAQASAAFNSIIFGKEDLPFLHRALLHLYPDDKENYGIHEKIREKVMELGDSTTVDFIAGHYASLKEQEEGVKYYLLKLLADIKTPHSYSLLKKLLLTGLPARGYASLLGNSLKDSLELTKTLFPEILVLARDSIFSETLASVTVTMLDSGLLSLAEARSWRALFQQQAIRNLESLKDSKKDDWYSDVWVELIARFNDSAGNRLLQDYLRLPVWNLKQAAAFALLENRQPVPASELDKLASDKYFRIELFKKMKELKKLQLFPAKYAHQKALAESEIWRLGSDDNYPSGIVFLEERTAMYQGAKQKFYLFRLDYEGEEGTDSYLGIAGPYALNEGELVTSSDSSSIYWKEGFTPAKKDKLFRQGLAEIAETH